MVTIGKLNGSTSYAELCQRHCTLKLLDFISAFLQGKAVGRYFVWFSSDLTEHFSDYTPYFGIAMMLKRSMYGRTLLGKWWNLDLCNLTNWLLFHSIHYQQHLLHQSLSQRILYLSNFSHWQNALLWQYRGIEIPVFKKKLRSKTIFKSTSLQSWVLLTGFPKCASTTMPTAVSHLISIVMSTPSKIPKRLGYVDPSHQTRPNGRTPYPTQSHSL